MCIKKLSKPTFLKGEFMKSNSKQVPTKHNVTQANPVILSSTSSSSSLPSSSSLSFSFLHSGIDTLNINLYVEWNEPIKLKQYLTSAKMQAQYNSPCFLCNRTVGDLYVSKKGSSQYEYHLTNINFNTYISVSHYSGNIPNGLICLRSHYLSSHSIDDCLALINSFISDLGGTLDDILVNRIDLFCDYAIPNGLTSDFLISHKVSRASQCSSILNNNFLGTFYVGSRQSATLCRIYNKSAELKAHNRSYFYCDVPENQLDHIWRVEFSLYRKALRQFGIDSIDDIKSKSAGLWHYLTQGWLRFCIPDSSNQTKRTVLPWWQDIQNQATQFGDISKIKRNSKPSNPCCDISWYISHLAGFLPSLAVLTKEKDLPKLLSKLTKTIKKHWGAKDWEAAYRSKVVQLGIPLVEDDVSEDNNQHKQ